MKACYARDADELMQLLSAFQPQSQLQTFIDKNNGEAIHSVLKGEKENWDGETSLKGAEAMRLLLEAGGNLNVYTKIVRRGDVVA